MPLRAALAFMIFLAATTGNAQSGKRQDAREPQMSQEERERMRDDMRDAYRHRQDRPQKARQQQMSPEERGRLRRDIEDANRNLKR
jgi:hypothetical protein